MGEEEAMGNAKQKWTAEEEAALHAGIRKHGPGKWQTIVKDPEFQSQLSNRTNIDLKDKWRNIKMSVNAAAQGSKEKVGEVKVDVIAEDGPPSNTRNPDRVISHVKGKSANTFAVNLPQLLQDDKIAQDVKTASGNQYSDMILEAFSAIPNTNGCEISEIYHFIQQRHVVQDNFKRSLSSRLRRLVSQGKLERDRNRYKLKKDAWLEANSLKPKKKDIMPRPKQNLGLVTPTQKENDFRTCPRPNTGLDASDEIMEAAAISAADIAADMVCAAENTRFDAAKKVQEAETLEREAADAKMLLMLSIEIYEQCLQSGVVIIGL